MKFIQFLQWFKAFSLAQRVSIGLATALVVGTCGTTVAVAGTQKNETYEEESVASVQTVEDEPESEEEHVEEAVRFNSLRISASSIEKDLDIFFLDNENHKIKGENFSVKLVSVADAAKLDKYVNAIAEVNESIKKAEERAGESSKSMISELSRKKVDAIDDYKEALKKINGAVYTDDNKDGRITQKKLEPGDFSLCYVPTAEYEADAYTQTTTVKDHIDYTPIENIEEKVVTAEEAGDVQEEHNVTTEVVLEDTVEYVESSEEGTPAEYAQTTAAELKASYSDPDIVEGDKGSVTVSKEVDLYPAIDDQASATIGVEAGRKDKIEIADVSDGLDAELNGNKLVITATNDKLIETTEGTVSLRVIAGGLTGSPEVKSSEAESSSSKEDKSEERVSASSKEENSSSSVQESSSSAQEESSSGSSTSGSSSEEDTEDEIITANITVTIHGSAEQLKDDEGHALFRDDKGANAATIEDYATTSAFFYEVKAAGAKTYTGWQTIGGAQYYYTKEHKKVTGPQVIRGVKYNFGTDGALLTSGVGIDVSKWQGSIDWAQAKSSISFAIIRAGFRGSSGNIAEDPYARTNIKGCNANGIRCGLYYYSIAMDAAQAKEEASHAIKILKESGGSISLPIFIDMEDSRQRALPDDVKDEIVMAFCKTVQNAGYSAGLYASKSWIEDYLTPSKYGSICMWVAQYNVSCNYSGHYDIWQYSSNGDVPGISTRVDMNEGKF